MAGLGGQVEDDLRALAKGTQVDVADVAADEVDVGAVKVAGIGAAAEQEAVERGNARAAGCEGVAEVGAEEAGTTRDEDFSA